MVSNMGGDFRSSLRVDSCLRRNDGRGSAGVAPAQEYREGTATEGSASVRRAGVPPSKSPPRMGGDFQSCVACGFLPTQEWRSCEHALVGGGAGLDDVEGVCGRVFALVPLGWLECAAVVEVGAYQLDVVGVV